jgi:transposase InsO family protein
VIRFRFVDEHRGAYGVKRICRVLEIDRSTYYDHLARAESRKARAVAEDELAQEIAEIHAASGGAYGAIRVTRELRARGRVVNKKRVARIMKERGIAGITRRKRKSLTKADKKAPPAPDLIRRDFTAVMPGIRLVGDITYLPTSEGWLYLATVIDLCTREVVGWSMAEHMRASLVIDAVRMAHAAGRVEGNAIFHSDRGSQYTSKEFRNELIRLDMRQSTGRTGSCFDNAAAESFFAVLKSEIGVREWATRTIARSQVFRWIAGYYNRRRLHSTIDYLTPVQARVRYGQPVALAA